MATGDGIEWPKYMQKKHLYTITQEQAVMRYNEHLVIPKFRAAVNSV
jgi:hypothetical protein